MMSDAHNLNVVCRWLAARVGWGLALVGSTCWLGSGAGWLGALAGVGDLAPRAGLGRRAGWARQLWPALWLRALIEVGALVWRDGWRRRACLAHWLGSARWLGALAGAVRWLSVLAGVGRLARRAGCCRRAGSARLLGWVRWLGAPAGVGALAGCADLRLGADWARRFASARWLGALDGAILRRGQCVVPPPSSPFLSFGSPSLLLAPFPFYFIPMASRPLWDRGSGSTRRPCVVVLTSDRLGFPRLTFLSNFLVKYIPFSSFSFAGRRSGSMRRPCVVGLALVRPLIRTSPMRCRSVVRPTSSPAVGLPVPRSP